MVGRMITESQLKQLIAEEYTKNSLVHQIQPKVSVSLLTYNHGPFIAQALNSILLQQVNFEYEIVIGEDCSQDNTREIVLSYLKDNPDKIRIFLSKKPLNDRKSGRLNFVRNLKACRGEYIALLDGDDYWSSPFKLQKQVDFLDDHPRYAICFHDAIRMYENGSQRPWLYPGGKKEVYLLADLAAGNFIPTCSTMFRNRLFSEFPGWYYEVSMGDWPLHIINAHYGDVGYIDEVMGVYRVHSRSRWSAKSRLDVLNDTINAAERIKLDLSSKYRKITDGSIIRWYLEIIELLSHGKDFQGASVHAKKCLRRLIAHKPVPNSALIRLVLVGYFPVFYRFLACKLLPNRYR
jgi:glycosyltransferase involved in cell wall biosynthesis